MKNTTECLSAVVCKSRRIVVSISYILCIYKSFGDNYLTIPMYLAESIHQETVMGTIKLQAYSQYATDFNSVWMNCWKPHLYRKGLWAHTESSLHDLTHDLTTTRNSSAFVCVTVMTGVWVSVCVHRQISPSSSNLFNRAVQKVLVQPISETSSPDKLLFVYSERVNKLAPKQKAVFQNHSRKKSR